MWDTARDSEVEHARDAAPVPGVVVVWSGDAPRLTALRLPPPGLVLGRDALPDDERLSRQHVRIRRDGDGFVVADLASRNGTYVNGRAIDDGQLAVTAPAVVRAGRTVALLVDDLEPFVAASVQVVNGVIVGPTLRAAWDAVERAARSGRALLLTGESGVGKELAAAAFHRASAVHGDLIAVNCAAIPHGLAERLLFGARKGAFSGADADADGYLQAADEGLLEEYRSPNVSQLYDWAQRISDVSKNRVAGVYGGILALGYNTEIGGKKKLPVPNSGSPTTWISGSRLSSSRKVAVICRRASCAPRQWWIPPPPKATCLFGQRDRSSFSGWSKTSGSRFAEE